MAFSILSCEKIRIIVFQNRGVLLPGGSMLHHGLAEHLSLYKIRVLSMFTPLLAKNEPHTCIKLPVSFTQDWKRHLLNSAGKPQACCHDRGHVVTPTSCQKLTCVTTMKNVSEDHISVSCQNHLTCIYKPKVFQRQATSAACNQIRAVSFKTHVWYKKIVHVVQGTNAYVCWDTTYWD